MQQFEHSTIRSILYAETQFLLVKELMLCRVKISVKEPDKLVQMIFDREDTCAVPSICPIAVITYIYEGISR